MWASVVYGFSDERLTCYLNGSIMHCYRVLFGQIECILILSLSIFGDSLNLYRYTIC